MSEIVAAGGRAQLKTCDEGLLANDKGTGRVLLFGVSSDDLRKLADALCKREKSKERR